MLTTEDKLYKKIAKNKNNLKKDILWEALRISYENKKPPISIFPKKYRHIIKSALEHREIITFKHKDIHKIKLKYKVITIFVIMMCSLGFTFRINLVDIYEYLLKNEYIEKSVAKNFGDVKL